MGVHSIRRFPQVRGCSAGALAREARSSGLWEDEHHRLSWTAGSEQTGVGEL